MFQKFNTDTLMSKFIKNLLEKESIPLYDSVVDGDILVENCLYIYRTFVIKCVKSGKLAVPDEDRLFPSENIYPSNYLVTVDPVVEMKNAFGEYVETRYFMTDIARFKVVANYTPETSSNYSKTYKSTFRYYDSGTHRYLGEYLRFYRTYKGIDLMPYYNCFTGLELNDVHLISPAKEVLHPADDLYPDKHIFPGMRRTYALSNTQITWGTGEDSLSTVYAIPVKFGKKYTIAVESASVVQLRAVMYTKTGMLKDKRGYYTDKLANSGNYMLLPFSRYSEPFLWGIETTDPSLYTRQRDLYLLLQVSKDTNSAITVLEGDYLQSNVVKADQVTHVREPLPFYNLSLLRYNAGCSYAFSDRLVEYLLDNVITNNDEFGLDIKYVQSSLNLLDKFYSYGFQHNALTDGVWNDRIRRSIQRIIEYNDDVYLQDQDGYINKDIEELLLQRGRYRINE